MKTGTLVRWMRLACVAGLCMSLQSQPITSPMPTQPANDAHVDTERSVVVPSGFGFEAVVESVGFVTAMAFATDGRLFLAEKSGLVRVFHNGVMNDEPFIDLRDEVNAGWDRGLLGMAVHPDWPTQPFVYVYLMRDPPGVERHGGGARVSTVLRIAAEPHDLNRAASGPDARTVIIGKASTRENIGDEDDGYNFSRPSCVRDGRNVRDCIPADAPVHNGGKLAFDADGALLLATGDSATSTSVDPRSLRAQDINSLAGKILRVDAMTGAGLPTNPFFNGDTQSNRSKVLYFGLRNPYRFAIYPLSGDVYIGDVGWEKWEEINSGPPGRNFGWPCFEGGLGESRRQPAYESQPDTARRCATLYTNTRRRLTAPSLAYAHGGEGGSILVGAFANNANYPSDYADALFIADFARRWVKTIHFRDDGGPDVRGFADDLPFNPIDLERNPDGDIFLAGYNYDTGYGSVYRLSGIANAERAFLPLSKARPTTLPRNVALEIESPISGTLYRVGDVIALKASARDENGLDLADSIEWRGSLYHGAHVHPEVVLRSGPSATFVAPDHGENTFLELCARVGASASRCVFVRPHKVRYTFVTAPIQGAIELGGAVYATPFSTEISVGGLRDLVAPRQIGCWVFESWSDGGAAERSLFVGESAQVITATYTHKTC